MKNFELKGKKVFSSEENNLARLFKCRGRGKTYQKSFAAILLSQVHRQTDQTGPVIWGEIIYFTLHFLLIKRNFK